MSQPPHDMYYDYAGPPNRSPSSSRQPQYAAGVFGAGSSLPRHSQRPFEPLSTASLYASDRLPGTLAARGLDHFPSGGIPGYSFDNSQSWNYNSASVATVNGAMNGVNRQRGVARRAGLPTTWTADPSGLGMHMPLQPFQTAGLQPAGLDGSMMSNGLRLDQHGASIRSMGQSGELEQLIPTAIVIKNIPFAVRKEQLTGKMMELDLPQPYAFNYHFDNGIFRGLAFANFQDARDTALVIEKMNGLEVFGRKLRVEYKKMLPEAERERIERDKRERRGQLEEQHRAPPAHVLHQQASTGSLNRQQPNSIVREIRDVDFNHPQTLKYWTDLTLFKADETREIFIFPPDITPEERRQIHIIAHYMGLEHRSVGDAESRQLHVVKHQMPSPTAPPTYTTPGLDAHRRGLSRAATFDFADRESRTASNSYINSSLSRQNPMLELPGSPDGINIANNLRGARSFADLRTLSPSPSLSSSSYLAPGAMAGLPRLSEYTGSVAPPVAPNDTSTGLVSQLGGLSLGSFEPAAAQARSTPGAIGSQRPGAGGSNRNAPERQPRGPEWEAAAGFGGRGKQNGHMQRGSDSSDNGNRSATGTAAPRF